MRSVFYALSFTVIAALPVSAAPTELRKPIAAAQQETLENIIYLDTMYGRVIIKLRPDLAPQHAVRIRTLAGQGFYDGIVFHRVIPGFMAQTGDPTGSGRGGSSLPNLPAEFSKAPFKRGTVGMARSQMPDSANSQFFICFDDASFLNGQYTVVGDVISGMEAIDKIKAGTQSNNGAVSNPDKIIKMRPAVEIN